MSSSNWHKRIAIPLRAPFTVWVPAIWTMLPGLIFLVFLAVQGQGSTNDYDQVLAIISADELNSFGVSLLSWFLLVTSIAFVHALGGISFLFGSQIGWTAVAGINVALFVVSFGYCVNVSAGAVPVAILIIMLGGGVIHQAAISHIGAWHPRGVLRLASAAVVVAAIFVTAYTYSYRWMHEIMGVIDGA